MKACVTETFTCAARRHSARAIRSQPAQWHFHNAVLSLIAWRAPLVYYENNSHLD